eukprot:2776244-Prymnesium_polylepis.1
MGGGRKGPDQERGWRAKKRLHASRATRLGATPPSHQSRRPRHSPPGGPAQPTTAPLSHTAAHCRTLPHAASPAPAARSLEASARATQARAGRPRRARRTGRARRFRPRSIRRPR